MLDLIFPLEGDYHERVNESHFCRFEHARWLAVHETGCVNDDKTGGSLLRCARHCGRGRGGLKQSSDGRCRSDEIGAERLNLLEMLQGFAQNPEGDASWRAYVGLTYVGINNGDLMACFEGCICQDSAEGALARVNLAQEQARARRRAQSRQLLFPAVGDVERHTSSCFACTPRSPLRGGQTRSCRPQ